MWFMIALFGGIYWIIRLSVGGAEQKQAVKEANIYANRYEEFLRSINDIGLEHDFTRKVTDPKYEDEIMSEIGSVWNSLPAIYPVQSMKTITREKVSILMAKRGLLSFNDMVRTCSCIEQKRYHVLNIFLRDELNRHGRDVELSELVDSRGMAFSTKLQPREICDRESVTQATTIKTESRCNSQYEREREEKMRSWIERCPHGRDFPISPDRYDTEEEYQNAVQRSYELWKSNRSPY